MVEGVTEEITGELAELTVKSVALVAVVCPATSTVIFPVVAPAGTVAVIWVPSAFTVAEAAVPLNFTAGVAPNPEPLIVTLDPTAPELGLNPLIVGPVPPPADAMNLMLSKRLFPEEAVAPVKVTRTKALAAPSRPVTVGRDKTPEVVKEVASVPATLPLLIVPIDVQLAPVALYSQS
jgi:hypothetical protein